MTFLQRTVVAAALATLFLSSAQACTIFVFRFQGKTYFCNNEDWRDPITEIRFNPAEASNYGWVYFGFGNDWAQGGVNEHGLCFDWFAGGGPFGWKSDPNKLNFDGNLSQELLRKCKNVDEAIKFYQRYNEANLDNAVTLIADREGNSLLVHWLNGKLVLEKRHGVLHPCGVGQSKVESLLRDLDAKFQPIQLTQALQASCTQGEFATKYSYVISINEGRIGLFQQGDFSQYLEIDFQRRLQQPGSTHSIAELFREQGQLPGIGLKKLTDDGLFQAPPSIENVSHPWLLQPDLRGDQIVFVAQGDLWAASERENWLARNLTETAVSESNPKISPDGLWVAYNHPLDGVMVVPFVGGQPKPLTFFGNQGAVFGWTQDGKIAYGSDESAPFPDSTGLSFVKPTGGQPEHTGVTEIGYAWFDPNGSEMIYSKSAVATGMSAKFHGGAANQILRLNLQSGRNEHLYPATWSRHSAVIIDGNAYFVGTEGQAALNLWRANSTGIQRLTDFSIDGVRSITSDGMRLVIERAGQLFWFDLNDGQLRPIPITFPQVIVTPNETTVWLKDTLTEVEPTGDGTAVAVVARGEVFIGENGIWQNISRLSGANDTMVAWSLDGQQLAYVSDRSGENAIYLWDRRSGQTRLLTSCSRLPVWIEWSPQGDGLYYLLDREAVRWVDLVTGRDQTVTTIGRWMTSHSVSPDGRFLALTAALENQRTSVVLVDRTTQKSYRLTDPRYIDTACSFDPAENLLYFFSRRNGRPDLSQEIPNLNLSGGMSLARIDLRDLPELSEQTDFRRRTQWIDSGDREVDQLSDHPRGWIASGADGEWIVDRNSFKWEQCPENPPGRIFVNATGNARARIVDDQLTVEHWNDGWQPTEPYSLDRSFTIDLREEWESMFWAVHRFHRDQFYDKKMLGVDWSAVGRHYVQYLPRLGTRDDLTMLMARMTGELPGGHNGVNGPNKPTNTAARPQAPESGLIVGWDGQGAKILRVLRGRTDMQMFGSLASGVEGKLEAGQYIRTVNGRAVTATLGFDELIVGIQPTDQVTVDISETIDGPVKQVQVQFLDNYLGYTDFLDRTIERVAQRSQGRIGYAHLFDTFSQGGGTFSDGFYSQWHLEGLILDARWNRGGNANPGFIDALQASALFNEVKKFGQPSLDTPTLAGPVALLVNRETVSGGDLLARAFQSRRVGTLIGDRTSGRTIGNQWYGQLIDGGSVRTSESHNLVWPSGEDAGENVGVRPDIEVPMDVSLEFSTNDAQLNRAVDTMLKKIEAKQSPCPPWIVDHSTPLVMKQVDTFSFLDQRLDNVRIVGFGEDTHGTAEFTEIAGDLMIYLNERHGYRILFIENGVGETSYLNDYLNGLRDDVETILRTKISTWRYKTKQFLQLLGKLREHNQKHPEKPIQIFGMEMHYPREEAELLNQYLAKSGMPPLAAPFDKTLYQDVSEPEMVDMLIAYHKTKKDLEQHKETLIAKTSDSDWREAMVYLGVIGQYVSAIRQETPQLKSDLRDLYMEVNVSKILANADKGSQAMIWAHNAHIGDWVGNGIVDVLGHQLQKRRGDSYFNIATHFGTGTYLAFPKNADQVGWNLQPITRESIEPTTITYGLNEYPASRFFLDFKQIRGNPNLAGLFSGPVQVMSGGGAQQYPQTTSTVDLGTAFDGLIFLRRSTPIELLD